MAMSFLDAMIHVIVALAFVVGVPWIIITLRGDPDSKDGKA